VFTLGNDSSMVRVSFVAPVYADDDTDDDPGGGGLDSCTDSCLYDATIASMLPVLPNKCKVVMEVKHKLYDPDDCCCHTAATILLEVRQVDEVCDCIIPMVMNHDYDSLGQLPCDYGVYHSCGFVVDSNDTSYYYKIYDSEDVTSCTISGSYQVDCSGP